MKKIILSLLAAVAFFYSSTYIIPENEIDRFHGFSLRLVKTVE